ncbi:MAG: hypothetical protein IPK66_16830 [Rhodospirillales bacterium]|nr:hypothetical protein [Rhodospirillales bacterium]
MRRIAIGCQGGGTHTAFTAGALAALIKEQLAHQDFEIVALSGTSGGAIGALLAWYGLLLDGGPAAIDRLEHFWQDGFPRGGAAQLVADRLANAAAVAALRLPTMTEVSPYTADRLLSLIPRSAQEPLRVWFDAQTGLRTIIEAFVDFSTIPALVARDRSRRELLIGAAEVLSGNFVVFRGTNPDFSVDAVVASGSLPELARATVIGSGRYAGVYWDGLYSQNPPISDFFDLGEGGVEDKPDEIWLIRINPEARDSEPRTLLDISDRRNEMGANQSLQTELSRARSINQLAEAFIATGTALGATSAEALAQFETSPLAGLLRRYKPVVLPEPIVMAPAVSGRLDHASKFDRNPAFLRKLLTHGQDQALAFLERRRQSAQWRATTV